MVLSRGVAAVVGAIGCFGSFGVPLKSRRVLEAQVDPLVLQLYQSLACFSSSLLLLLFKELSWTWDATLGASIWVATGTLAIFAIQRAGLGVAQATLSSVAVAIAYLCGAVGHQELGSSVGLSFLGLLLVGVGLAGVAHAAHAPPRPLLRRVPSAESTSFFHPATLASTGSQGQGSGDFDGSPSGGVGALGLSPIREASPTPEPAGDPALRKAGGAGAGGSSTSVPDLQVRIGANLHHRSISAGDLAAAGGGGGEGYGSPNYPLDCDGTSPASSTCKDLEAAWLLGAGPGELRIILRQNWGALHVRLHTAWHSHSGRGVLAAAAAGVLNGAFAVPWGRRRSPAQGTDLAFSFAASALLAALLVCCVWYGLVRRQVARLHVRAVAAPALLAGLLWSGGNLCSIWAVEALGPIVGLPLLQCQLLVSTAWSVLHYQEVPSGSRGVAIFVGSILLSVLGMSLLVA